MAANEYTLAFAAVSVLLGGLVGIGIYGGIRKIAEAHQDFNRRYGRPIVEYEDPFEGF